MGCPAPKIAGNGGGASLAKNPELAEKIVKAVVEASPVPVTVKIRMGWDENSINAVEMAKRMMEKGVYVVAFSYPVVPRGKARIRTQMSAALEKEDILYIVECFRQVKEEMGI